VSRHHEFGQQAAWLVLFLLPKDANEFCTTSKEMNVQEVLFFCKRCHWALCLGMRLRAVLLLHPDANDAAQFAELKTQGELTRRAWERDVQVLFPATRKPFLPHGV